MDATATKSSSVAGSDSTTSRMAANAPPFKPRNEDGGINVGDPKKNHVKRARPTRNKKKATKPQDKEAQQPDTSDNLNAKTTVKNKPRKNTPRRRFPWRKHVPADTVDPITLENLISLTYPPFALVASEPYAPVPEWPIPTATQAESQQAVESGSKEDEEERQKRILQEQWGSKAGNGSGDDDKDVTPADESKNRHYHLYDGRALAYYMVSQLQFIDPLNRRDLTRREMEGLDQYLQKHGLSTLSVVEAYDKRGITISTAGAAGNTEAGRAAILQQEATQLLNALFAAPSNRPASATSAPATNRLRAQYQAHEQHQEAHSARVRQSGRRQRQEDSGVYGQGGLMVIDDTLNPHLRGSLSTSVQESGSGRSALNPLWSASHITRSFRSTTPQPVDFPALAATLDATQPPPAAATEALLPKKVGATMSVISKAIKKTDPGELQRQREAREAALYRAAAANLPFGVQPQTQSASQPPLSTVTMVTDAVISDGQLERNMAMADALGIKPKLFEVNHEEKTAFTQELTTIVYPDSLILQAKERPVLLLKLEKKWRQLVKDEATPSLSLMPMDRPTRVFVHAYSDFWNLETRSYDPEGKRYIHCRKLLDSNIPQPLLSDAVRNWKGPSLILRPLPKDAETRAPLALKPRTSTVLANLSGKPVSGIAISGDITGTVVSDTADITNSRLDGLVRERPKLALQQRSLPLELAPAEFERNFDIAEELERQQQRAEERARKERDRKAREQRAIQSAFASDDESSVVSSHGEYRGAW